MKSNNQRLRRALNFTEEDLAANRQGRMTTSQLFHLVKRTAGYMLGAAAIMFVVLALTGGLFSSSSFVLVMYALAILVSVPWLAYIRGNVKVVEGKLSKHTPPTVDAREPPMSYVKVKDLDFYVPHAVFDCFVEGLDYRIFYTALGKQMVSAERIDLQAHQEIPGESLSLSQ